MKRALVIGGSLGGLLAAHLLRGAGWHPCVFEGNAEELTGRGVRLGTHPQLIAVLRRARSAFDETMGVKVPKVVYLDLYFSRWAGWPLSTFLLARIPVGGEVWP